jgi:hypothetical protein
MSPSGNTVIEGFEQQPLTVQANGLPSNLAPSGIM